MSTVPAGTQGYRQLSANEQAAINLIKNNASLIEALVKNAERDPTLDQRWVAIGKTQLQQGFMSLVRATARPEGF